LSKSFEIGEKWDLCIALTATAIYRLVCNDLFCKHPRCEWSDGFENRIESDHEQSFNAKADKRLSNGNS